MNCEWAEQVALLEPPSPELRAHLASCAECRELLADLEADQVLLQQPPEVPEGVVSRAVLRRLALRRWRFAPVAVMAAAAVLAFVMLRTPATSPAVPQVPPPVAVVIPDPAEPAPVAVVAERTRRPGPRPNRPQQADPDKLMASLAAMLATSSNAIASADTPVLITTQTADPDVVIVLVPEKTGDEE